MYFFYKQAMHKTITTFKFYNSKKDTIQKKG